MMESKYHQTNFFKRTLSRMHRQPRGQSFVELMLVMTILALRLAGTVEFGLLLNNYLKVLDGAREAARYDSANLAFSWDNSTNPATLVQNPSFYNIAVSTAAATMTPVTLNPANSPTHIDDIIVSVFSLSNTHNTIVRFPPGDPNGWSLCNHYAAFAAAYPAHQIPAALSVNGDPDPHWSACGTGRVSQITIASMQTIMNHYPAAPNSGVLVVEIYYNYPQLLKLPVLTTVLADPVPLYVYTIMPLSSAEPTQVP